MSGIFTELKRRRVIRVVLAYVVVGWALIEVAATLFPMFGAPSWMPRAFTMLVALGLPVAALLAWAFQVTPQGIERDIGATADQGKVRYVTTSDGVRIAYALSGDGPPIVKVAHWLTNLELDWQSRIWRHWLTALADGRLLVRYDERGCGLSDRHPADLSLAAMTEDVERVVDATGLERFNLFGSSQGGPVAINYVLRHPERVNALILYGSYAAGWSSGASEEELERGRAMVDLIRLGWGQDNPAFRQMFGALLMPDADELQRESFDQMTRESTSPEMAAQLISAMGKFDVRDRLSELALPVLVIHTRGDARVTLERGKELAKGIPQAEFISLDGNNHIIMEGDAAFVQFKAAIDDFLRRHPI